MVIRSGKDQLLQFAPVVQPIAKMDILRYIAHNGIRTAAQTIGQGMISHHTIILCFINNHMRRLTDTVCLFNAFVKICKRGQIIYIKGVFRKRY